MLVEDTLKFMEGPHRREIQSGIRTNRAKMIEVTPAHLAELDKAGVNFDVIKSAGWLQEGERYTYIDASAICGIVQRISEKNSGYGID